MENEWKKETFEIVVGTNENLLAETVSGIGSGGFGIHEIKYGWNVTHVKSGWSAFTCTSCDGAKIIARHLIENYSEEFDRIKFSGSKVENFKSLQEKIRADRQLLALRKLFAYSASEMAALGLMAHQKAEVVS